MAKSDCGKAAISFPENRKAAAEMERIFPQPKRRACEICGVRLPKGSTQCPDCQGELGE